MAPSTPGVPLPPARAPRPPKRAVPKRPNSPARSSRLPLIKARGTKLIALITFTWSQVCDDYRLTSQTAWTAVHYFDRYLAARGAVPIERDEAELVSLTCVFVAAKYVERQSPVRTPPTSRAGVATSPPPSPRSVPASPPARRLATRAATPPPLWRPHEEFT